MKTEEAFERDILDHPFDDARRLIYADWLEERGDERGEFLRLQHDLSRMAVGDKGYREGCAREKKLLKTLDKVWVHRMRRYTTAPPCCDVAKLVPELAPFARTTIRLHPRRTVGKKEAAESNVGGQFLWPRGEDWPFCAVHGTPYIAAVQLRKFDVPNVPFFGDSDLFQLLWCPFDSDQVARPHCVVIWRRIADVTNPVNVMPPYNLIGLDTRDPEVQKLLPKPCSLYPERVVEYPDYDELDALTGKDRSAEIAARISKIDLGPVDLRDRLSEDEALSYLYFSEDDPLSCLYEYEFSRCPGTKAGGKPPCKYGGKVFEHLLTLSSWEFSPACFRRWVSQEDQRRLARTGQPFVWKDLVGKADFHPLREPLGMQFGRTQRLHLYVCRKGKNWPIHVQVYD
jgi:uncharacterized protein (TIGR02996 family)